MSTPSRLTFGTAGIRGPMGSGLNQMNDLVIIQTSQGLASYLLEFHGAEQCKKSGVIVGHDARHNSDRFARLTALAFLEKGIRVYYCDKIIPTPLIAFGVKQYNCCAGIVITASHNPKEDNGYKVYWSNGAQILSPHDKNIQAHIEKPENLESWPKAWNHEYLLENGSKSAPKEWLELLSRVHKELSDKYNAYIERELVGERHSKNSSSDIRITFTAMHGVGHEFLTSALTVAGFKNVFAVDAQKQPDPEFPTVKFPNPEEPGALDLAFETAKQTNSNLILANDPDADRCAAAIYHPASGCKRAFNGNEIGALLGWWAWHCHQEASKAAPVQPEDCYMLSTTVSSVFLKTMACVEGFKFIETLTGFKYMGNASEELINQGKTVLFACEESIGFMVHSKILDKDGISAGVQLAQCASHLSSVYKRTLEDQLDLLYSTYGYHFSSNSYFVCRDQAKIKAIFQELQANYPKDFGDEFCVTRVRDLNNGYDSGTEDNKPTLPTSTGSFMVTFFIGDEVTFTIRTSGTEPKIKYYSEIVAKLPADAATNGSSMSSLSEERRKKLEETKVAAKDKLNRFLKVALGRCLKPGQYGLESAN